VPRERYTVTIAVLIVDDSPIMRNILKTTLELCDRRPDFIYEAADGIEALEYLQKEDIAIAFVDIHMPRMSGLELVERLNQDPHHRSLAIAVVSSDGHNRALAPFIEYGVRATIRKPFHPEQIRDVYRSLVNLQRHKVGA
jgi:two-component system chemotaxis response regulator CheY